MIQDSVLNDPKIEVRFHTEVTEFLGANEKLNALRTHNNRTGRDENVSVDGAFVFIGLDPNTSFLREGGLHMNAWGFVVTGHDLVHDAPPHAHCAQREPAALETSVPGIFAAGDVRQGSTKQVASAAGEGAAVALLVREYLKTV